MNISKLRTIKRRWLGWRTRGSTDREKIIWGRT